MKISGFSTRADGETRANFPSNPATGQDRAAVNAVRRALGHAVECPACGGVGTVGKNGCRDGWHITCGH